MGHTVDAVEPTNHERRPITQRRSRLRQSVLMLALVLVVSSCAAGGVEYAETRAGFFSGIWHGWIAPASIIWHVLFDNNIRIYETNNTGIGYDIGFYLAVISGFGTLSLKRGRRD